MQPKKFPQIPKYPKTSQFRLCNINSKSSLWTSIHQLQTTPQARATLFRLMHNRLPRRIDGSNKCPCGEIETIDHIIGECSFMAPLRHQLIFSWTEILRKILPICKSEFIKSNSEKEWNNLPKLKAPVFSFPIPSNIWKFLPVSNWKFIPEKGTKIAKSFNYAWKLSTSFFVYCLWLNRNEQAYGTGYWGHPKFVSAYNNLFNTYMPLTTCDPKIRAIFAEAILKVPNTGTNQADHTIEITRPHNSDQHFLADDNSPRSRNPP